MRKLRGSGINGLRIMVNREAIRIDSDTLRRPRSFEESLKLNRQQTAELVRIAREEGMRRITLTFWPQSTQPATFASLVDFIEVVSSERNPVDAVEWDVEGYGWYKPLSPAALRQAGDELERQWRRVCRVAPRLQRVEVCATTYPYGVEVCRRSLPWVRRWTPQAYSQHRQGDAAYSYNGRFGVGGMQRLAARKMRESNEEIGTTAVVDIGLAAYRQDFPGRDRDKVMRETYRAAALQGVTVVCYWSAKWIVRDGLSLNVEEVSR